MRGGLEAITIRTARVDDAPAISALIERTLREVNSRDYGSAVIDDLVRSFAPDRLAEQLGERTVLVAVAGDAIVGVAGFDGRAVRSMFVRPDRQRQGIGKRLVTAVEDLARDRGVLRLSVQASLTAAPFYRALGYAGVREHQHGAEVTVIMGKRLG